MVQPDHWKNTMKISCWDNNIYYYYHYKSQTPTSDATTAIIFSRRVNYVIALRVPPGVTYLRARHRPRYGINGTIIYHTGDDVIAIRDRRPIGIGPRCIGWHCSLCKSVNRNSRLVTRPVTDDTLANATNSIPPSADIRPALCNVTRAADYTTLPCSLITGVRDNVEQNNNNIIIWNISSPLSCARRRTEE